MKNTDRQPLLELPNAQAHTIETPAAAPIVAIFIAEGELDDLLGIIDCESEPFRKIYIVQGHAELHADSRKLRRLHERLKMPVQVCRRNTSLAPGSFYFIPHNRCALKITATSVRLRRSKMAADANSFFSSLATRSSCSTVLVTRERISLSSENLSRIINDGGRAWIQYPANADKPAEAIRAEISPLELSDIQWHQLSLQFNRHFGLALEQFRRDRVNASARRRMRHVGAKTFAEYEALLNRDRREATNLLLTLTNSGQGFLKNPDQVDKLMSTLIPVASGKRGGETLSVWLISNGATTDPYTLGILCLEALAATGDRSTLEVFATALDSASLTTALNGVFSEREILDLPSELVQRYFTRHEGQYRIADRLAERIHFRVYRPLIDPPPRSTFDLICCQIPLGFLTASVRDKLWSEFAQHLSADGLICILAAAASTPSGFHRVNTDAPAIYRRSGNRASTTGMPAPSHHAPAPTLRARSSPPDSTRPSIRSSDTYASPPLQMLAGISESYPKSPPSDQNGERNPEMLWLGELGIPAMILDNVGEALGINAAWRQQHLRCWGIALPESNWNFLQHCLEISMQAPAFGRLHHGVQAVLAGHRSDFSVTCPYTEHGVSQWYRTTIAPVRRHDARHWLVISAPVPPPTGIDDLLVLALALDRSEDGFVIADMTTPAQTVIYANRTSARLLGYHETLVGASLRTIFPALPHLAELPKHGDESVVVPPELLGPGSEPLEMSVSAITTLDGAKTHIGVTFRVWSGVEPQPGTRRNGKRRDRNALTLAGIGLLEWDLDRDQIRCSEVHNNLLGWAISDAPRRYEDLKATIHMEDRARVEHAMNACASGRTPLDIEYRIVRPDRTVHWLRSRGNAVLSGGRTPLKLVCLSEDVSEKKNAEAFSHFAAYHDALTHLPNRVLLTGRFDQAITHARRSGQGLAIVFLDLDKFKNINDIFGHHVGDELLKAVAKRLAGTVRATDTVCRYSGDEFIIMITGLKAIDEVRRVVEKIRASLQETFLVEGHALTITSSIGIAMFPNDAETLEQLVRSADAAMYQSKNDGRNTVNFFTQTFNENRRHRGDTSRLLGEALREHSLELYYQPQIDFQTGALIGIEALARWHHPQLGLSLPATFIPVAEESELIFRIGEWALIQACTQNRAWQDAGLCQVPISVNLSAGEFRHRELPQRVAAALNLSGLAPEHLELELTERAIAADFDLTSRVVQDLRDMRLRVSIDNFGAGHAGMACLRRFPFDRLKIDRSFVSSIPQDTHATTIVKAVINMAQGLGLPIIAEGVESEQQASFLKAEGCSAYQGYLFSPPVPAADFEDVVRRYLRRATV